jgi:hypothetical protein
VHAGLGRRIVGLAESAFLAVYGGHVDDAAPAALGHAVDHVLGHVEDAVEIGLGHGVPRRLVHFAESHVAGDARVVDEDIDRSRFGHDR